MDEVGVINHHERKDDNQQVKKVVMSVLDDVEMENLMKYGCAGVTMVEKVGVINHHERRMDHQQVKKVVRAMCYKWIQLEYDIDLQLPKVDFQCWDGCMVHQQ